MDAFKAELMRRSPLAACVLESCDFIFEEQLLKSIWDEHRGRCYDDVLHFDQFLRMMRDALVRYGGSAHQLYVQLESARPTWWTKATSTASWLVRRWRSAGRC